MQKEHVDKYTISYRTLTVHSLFAVIYLTLLPPITTYVVYFHICL